MTKLREPLTFELSLTKVAGQITWPRVAEIAGQSERTVRDWSEPDTRPTAGRSITLDVALALDVAFRASGGIGAPMLHCYATKLELDVAEACGQSVAIAAAAARAARESGLALQAAIQASQPGADPRLLAIAEREGEQAIEASTELVTAIEQARRHGSSAPEVAPPAEVAQPPP